MPLDVTGDRVLTARWDPYLYHSRRVAHYQQTNYGWGVGGKVLDASVTEDNALRPLQPHASEDDQRNRLTVRRRRGQGLHHYEFCLFNRILLAGGGDPGEAACSHGATSEEDGDVELPGSGSSLPIKPRILMQVSVLSACPCITHTGALPLESAGDMPKIDGIDGKRGQARPYLNEARKTLRNDMVGSHKAPVLLASGTGRRRWATSDVDRY
ncbi:hypothetical protein MANI_027537 [Metarhizium anisopliae]|nr:hypothetical protein MANI_027537 [Metarhizium anisopliae]